MDFLFLVQVSRGEGGPKFRFVVTCTLCHPRCCDQYDDNFCCMCPNDDLNLMCSWLGMLPGTWAYVSAGAIGRAFIVRYNSIQYPQCVFVFKVFVACVLSVRIIDGFKKSWADIAYTWTWMVIIPCVIDLNGKQKAGATCSLHMISRVPLKTGTLLVRCLWALR